jgi:hypothetical protein
MLIFNSLFFGRFRLNVVSGRNIDEELSQLQVLHIEALNDLEKTRNLLRLMIINIGIFYMFRTRDGNHKE